jgi:hypothetical protein
MEAEQSIASAEEVSELSSSLDWACLWPRMVSHTLGTMRRRYRLKGSTEELHDTAQELVEECFRRVFVTQSRKWNKSHYVEPEKFLFDVLESLVNNWFKEKKSKLKFDADAVLDDLSGDHGSEADAHLKRDEVLREYTTQLTAMGADDDEMLIFNARVYDGLTTPEEIRDNLGMTDVLYHNAFRRLYRRLQKIRAKLDQ